MFIFNLLYKLLESLDVLGKKLIASTEHAAKQPTVIDHGLFHIAGVEFEGRQDIIKVLTTGLPVHIKADTTTNYPFRIAVMVGNTKVGYVPDKRPSIANKFHKMWKNGHTIKTTSWKPVTGSKGILGVVVSYQVEE